MGLGSKQARWPFWSGSGSSGLDIQKLGLGSGSKKMGSFHLYPSTNFSCWRYYLLEINAYNNAEESDLA